MEKMKRKIKNFKKLKKFNYYYNKKIKRQNPYYKIIN